MSQYCSRIHIKVSSPDVWRKFEDEDDASFDLASLADTDRTSFIIDGDWSCYERELKGIVNALSETLGKDGIIIADCTNINVDPYEYCVYYFGDEVYSAEFSVLDYYDSEDEESEDEDYNDQNPGMMFFNTDISDIAGWLSYGNFDLYDEEEEQLFRCGISVSADGSFSEFSADINIPEKVYLRETSFENRPDTIEKSFVSEEVYFVEAPDEYDKTRLEVMSDLGSLGYLPSNVTDQIYYLFDRNRLSYTAQIVELVRPSQRNVHSRSSIVGIHIDAELSKEEVPQKNSVPKVDRDALAKAERQQEELLRHKEEATAEQEKLRQLEEERIAKEKAEADARKKAEEAQRAEQERKRKAEEERLAKEKEEAERLERLRVEEQARIAKEKAEAEARKKAEEAQRAEQERKRKAEEERLAKEKEEAERLERLRVEEQARIAKEKAEAEARRKAEEKRRRKEAQRLAEEEAEAERKRKEALESQERIQKYKEAHDKWLLDCEETKTKRSNRVNELIVEEKAKLLKEAIKKRDEVLNAVNERIASETNRKSLAESTLSSLGLFKFGEKKKQKAIIEEASRNITEAKKELENVNQGYDSEIAVIDETVKKKTTSLRNIAEKEYPMPEEPVKPIN